MPRPLPAVLLATALLAALAAAQAPASTPTPGKPVLLNGKMWTFDQPPTAYLADTYGFQPDAAWFDAVRMAALRFSGSPDVRVGA